MTAVPNIPIVITVPKTTIKTPIVTTVSNIPIVTTVSNRQMPIIKPVLDLSPLPDLASTTKKTKQSSIPISTSKKSSKESEDILSMSVYAPGDRFAIYVTEEEIKNDYDNVIYLENKLNDTSLSNDECSKIYEGIRQARLNIPKNEQKLDKLKKGIEKRIKTNQTKLNIPKEVIKDQDEKLLYPTPDLINVEEMLLKIDNDNIDALNNILRNNKLSVDEYNKIVDDIDKLKKSRIKRKQELDNLKKDL